MIRVALVIESERLRDDLRSIVRESDRLRLAPDPAADSDAEPFGVSDPEVLVFDDALASQERALLAHAAGVPIVVMTDDGAVAASLGEARSALALLPTDATAEEVVAAVEGARAGLFVIHADLASEDEPAPAEAAEALTPRELEVLQRLAAGLANKAIATQLLISEHTAKFHVSQILAKLGAASRAEAVSIAMRRGLVPL